MKLSKMIELLQANLAVYGDKEIIKVKINTERTESYLYKPKNIEIIHNEENTSIIFNSQFVFQRNYEKRQPLRIGAAFMEIT